jgi:cysteine-rich repeat protein
MVADSGRSESKAPSPLLSLLMSLLLRSAPLALILVGCLTSNPIGPVGIVEEDGEGGGEEDGTATVSSSAAQTTTVTTGGDGGEGGSLPSSCGDGVVDTGEECDDENTVDDDGCSACEIDCAAGETKEPTTGHCYRVFTGNTMQPDAEADCQAWGGAPGLGHLVSIEDAAESAFVDGLVDANAWIGADDFGGTWAWIDDTPYTFENWQIGEPNHPGTEHCMFMDVEAKWHDHDCGDVRPAYVCERGGAGAF